MRLEVTRRAHLAVRAIALLAGADQVEGAELDAALEATPAFVPQVVGPLGEAGWVASTPGPVGGYALIVPAVGLTVLDVVDAVDRTIDNGRWVVTDRLCARDATGDLHVAWERARHSLVGSLADQPVTDTVDTFR